MCNCLQRWVTVQPCKCYLTLKMNITFFYQKLDAEYFLLNNFFEKGSMFPENHKKLFSGTFDDFLGKRSVFPQKLT